eukprot:8214701-Pyramimonas_sp.AAC.2
MATNVRILRSLNNLKRFADVHGALPIVLVVASSVDQTQVTRCRCASHASYRLSDFLVGAKVGGRPCPRDRELSRAQPAEHQHSHGARNLEEQGKCVTVSLRVGTDSST